MPSKPKPPKASSDGPLLKTWRQEGATGTRAKVWLSVRRLSAIAIALGLMGWLGYLMLSPLLLPKSYFAYWCTDEVQPLVVPPMEYCGEDFAGFTKLENALTPTSSGSKALSYGRLMTPAVLQGELDALKESSIQAEHPVIVFVSAHGIVRDGKPYLICGNFTAAEGNESLDGLYSVSKLVKQLADVPGGIKLLLLDATRNDYSPRLGMIENKFADALKQEMSALKLPSVWVLNSSSSGEKSHVSPALRRSVFGYMCASGLQGAADKNNDGEIKLNELTDFVQLNVAQWVKQSTGDAASQTPMLLSAGAGAVEGEGPHLLYVSNLPKVEPVSAVMSSAQSDDSRTGIVAAVQDFLSDEVDEFGFTPIFTAIDSAKEKLGLNADDDESEDDTKSEPEVDETAQRETQNDVELGLFDEAWRLTQAIPPGPRHPVSYAPDLWRLHLDRLAWLEYQQQSGERMNQLPLIDELRGLIQSLKNFQKVSTAEIAKDANVVDRLRQLTPTAPLVASDAPTMGLAEAISAADPRRQLPEKLSEFLKNYDSWLNSPDGMDRLDALKETNWNSDWAKYYELQLLDAYRGDPGVSLDTAKLALETRRLGERVSANLDLGKGWSADAIDQGDRLRLEAERLLKDHADSQWLEKATGNLQRARTLYADGQTQLVNVQQAAQLQNETLVRCRDYLRWCRYCWGDAASRAPSAQRIEGLLVSLKDLHGALDSANGVSTPNVSDLRRIHEEIERQLSQGVTELASSPYEPGDSERVTALLKTALLDAEQRTKCIEARIDADAELMRGFEFSVPASAMAPPATNSARDILALDQLKAECMLIDAFSPSSDQSHKWPDMSQASAETIAAASKVLGNRLFNINSVVTDDVEANSNLSDLARRTQRLRQLHSAATGLYLVDSIDADSVSRAEDSVMQQVNNAMWYDLLASLRNRFVHAQADATPMEVDALRQLANQCGVQASDIPGQPEIMNVEPPQLALQVPSTAVELVAVDEATIDFSVQSFSDGGPVWVVAQYDPNAIAVTGVDWTILSEQDVIDTSVNENSTRNPGYPYWPQSRRNISETMTLTAGQSRNLGITVRRLSNARGDTTLVLKAIDDKNYVRQEIPVRLPGRQDLEITIAGARSIPRNLDSKIGLFANRIQELTVYLKNTGTEERSVVASFYAPQQPLKFTIPTGSLESTAAEQILQRIGTRSGVAIGSTPLKLSAGSSAQPLRFEFQTPENKMLLGATPKEGPIKLPVPHGLLLDIVDQESREHTIRWLQFEVWRPHAFLNARATYDPGSRRLLVTAEAIDPNLCPDGEVELTLDVDKKFVSARGGGTYSTFLKAPDYRGELETTLTGRWPRDLDPLADDYLPIRVNVDKYPRGFDFRLPKTTTITNLRPTRDKASLRFVTPQPEAAYAASNSIAAQIQVEVPEGYFNVPNSFVEVGIDKNQDRELRDEESIVLRSDRQLELFVELPTNGGTLAFEPEVSDFALNLRTTGISDREVNVLGQLTAAGRISERSYVPVVLDGEGPELGVVKLVRNGPLLVVELNPQDLTGVKSVEAAFESSTEVKWEPGKLGNGGKWYVELNTKELTPGEYTVLLRATDDVGNICDVTSTPWTNDPAEAPAGTPEQAAPNPVAKVIKNQVKGRVVYGARPVTEGEVTLAGPGAPAQPVQTRAGGAFDFGMVMPGTYTLSARGLAGGNYHKAELKVTVSDQPESPVELEVKVR